MLLEKYIYNKHFCEISGANIINLKYFFWKNLELIVCFRFIHQELFDALKYSFLVNNKVPNYDTSMVIYFVTS